jgi:hypothetical protein
MYRKGESEKIAEKLIKIFANGTVLPHDWKFNVPRYLMGETFFVLRNLNNFVDGLKFHMELYDKRIPSEELMPDFPVVGDDDPIKVFEVERNLFLEREHGIVGQQQGEE